MVREAVPASVWFVIDVVLEHLAGGASDGGGSRAWARNLRERGRAATSCGAAAAQESWIPPDVDLVLGLPPADLARLEAVLEAEIEGGDPLADAGGLWPSRTVRVSALRTVHSWCRSARGPATHGR